MTHHYFYILRPRFIGRTDDYRESRGLNGLSVVLANIGGYLPRFYMDDTEPISTPLS